MKTWCAAKTESHQGLVIDEETGCNVAVTYDKADATLVAAAPDLLATLKAFTTWHANNFEDFSSEINTQLLCLANDASAAITKAEGEA